MIVLRAPLRGNALMAIMSPGPDARSRRQPKNAVCPKILAACACHLRFSDVTLEGLCRLFPLQASATKP